MGKTKGEVILVVAFAVAMLALPPSIAYAQQQGPDHFKTYLTSGELLPVPIEVSLKDQFGTVEGPVHHLIMFSNPVQKEVIGGGTSPILDPEDHLTWYDFPGPTPQKKILVTNQFGTDKQWVVRDTAFLLAPAWKYMVNGLPTPHVPPVGLDHYLCYNVVSGAPIGVDVRLEDQFHWEAVTVLDPVVFCNPVEKTLLPGGPTYDIIDPDTHLACYDITPKLPPPISMVATNDQFGDLIFGVYEPQFLCVPSTKKLAPTYPATANTIAASYGRNSLIGSGVFNGLVLVFVPVGMVIFLRIRLRKK